MEWKKDILIQWDSAYGIQIKPEGHAHGQIIEYFKQNDVGLDVVVYDFKYTLVEQVRQITDMFTHVRETEDGRIYRSHPGTITYVTPTSITTVKRE